MVVVGDYQRDVDAVREQHLQTAHAHIVVAEYDGADHDDLCWASPASDRQRNESPGLTEASGAGSGRSSTAWTVKRGRSRTC